jgi:hypothetical protein
MGASRPVAAARDDRQLRVRKEAHRRDTAQRARLADAGLPETLQAANRLRLVDSSISTQKHLTTGQHCRGALEISEFFGSLLRSDIQAGPTRRRPPDGHDVSRFARQRWGRWEGSTARLQQ